MVPSRGAFVAVSVAVPPKPETLLVETSKPFGAVTVTTVLERFTPWARKESGAEGVLIVVLSGASDEGEPSKVADVLAGETPVVLTCM